MNDVTLQMLKSFLQGQGKIWGAMAASYLVSRHIIDPSMSGMFADIVAAGVIYAAITFWSWWNASGRALLEVHMKKLTGTTSVADATKVAQQLPATPPASVQAVAATVVKVCIALMFVVALAASANAQGAIGKAVQGLAQRNDTNRIGGPVAVSPLVSAGLTGDPVADLHTAIQKGGAKLILHLKLSYALAVAKGINGEADNTSAMCSKALVPIFDLVINGPKAGTVPADDSMALNADEIAMAANTSEPVGPLVQIEKLRILRLALTSPALNDACGALVQDEVKNAQSLVGKITSLVTGAGLAGVTGGLIP